MLLVLYLYSGIHFLLLAMRGSRNFFRWVGGVQEIILFSVGGVGSAAYF